MAAFFEYLRNITYYLLFSTLVGMAAPSGKYKKYVSLITGLVLLLLMIQPLKNLAGSGVPVTEWFSGAASIPVMAGEPAPALPPGSAGASGTSGGTNSAGESGTAGSIGSAGSAAAGDPESVYAEWSRTQIGAAFEEQLYAQVESLLSKEGYTLLSAEFGYEPDFSRITEMNLAVEVPPEGAEKPNRPFIRIETVTIEQETGRKAGQESGQDAEPGAGQESGQGPDPAAEPEDENISRIKKLLTDFYAPDTPHINVTTSGRMIKG